MSRRLGIALPSQSDVDIDIQEISTVIIIMIMIMTIAVTLKQRCCCSEQPTPSLLDLHKQLINKFCPRIQDGEVALCLHLVSTLKATMFLKKSIAKWHDGAAQRPQRDQETCGMSLKNYAG